ncbi:hypothetical protein SLEP1_g57905 [Rubroshorea leprosula]|uniref:Uncharacterized protein n=1 Tax=Rubroshorea leprosula TaxID=152421 RepID=A0AAV5MP92_9ROSI|nr:hypothetical protein SLEP1_g57905 [Rubroshorea leprosula]
MSRDASSSRFVSQDAWHEANENEFECSLNQAHFHPPRTPLNAIADPSQCQKEKQSQECDADSKDKYESGKMHHHRLSNGKSGMLNLNLSIATQRGMSRHGKVHSEPNSAQSTPTRSSSRVSAVSRVSQVIGRRVEVNAGSSSRVSRGISMIDNSDLSNDVPHLELDEDPLFWTDHINVQVYKLITLRLLF